MFDFVFEAADPAFIAAQLLALLACGCNCVSFLLRSKSKFLLWQLGSNVAYGLQYFLLGAYTALINNIVSLLKLLVFHRNARRNSANPAWMMWLFCGLSLLLGLLVLDSRISVIPIVVAFIYTYATWQDEQLRLKLCVALCSLLWIAYNYKVRAYVAMVYSIVEFFVALLAALKLWQEKKAANAGNS